MPHRRCAGAIELHQADDGLGHQRDELEILGDQSLVADQRASSLVEVILPLGGRGEQPRRELRELALRVRAGESKWLLRRVLDRYMPRELVERPKMGFGVPLANWLRGPLREWAEDLLDPQRLGGGFLDVRAVRQLWLDHVDGGRNWAYALWTVLMFEAWRRRCTRGTTAQMVSQPISAGVRTA